MKTTIAFGLVGIAMILETFAFAEDVPPAPLVRVAVSDNESPCLLSGSVERLQDGTLCLPAQPPWSWITVGKDERPLTELESLQSLTICGWVGPTSLRVGSGGNRIAFTLNYNCSGFDLVHLEDGRLRLAVNQWPDRVQNDSSPARLQTGTWTFFAVTYDSTENKSNVCWYFGAADSPAQLDRKTTYLAGPTGTGSGPLTIGNYNRTIHQHGTDRQFRGRLHGIQVFGSRNGSEAALALSSIRKLQADPALQPDFTRLLPRVRSTPPLHSTSQTDAAEPGVSVPMPPPDTRPRIIATTDGEIDDRCSMVRFLLYANQWDIEGIIYSSSKFHWVGHNWDGTDWIQQDIAKYASFYDTLKTHAPGFPTPQELREKVFVGNIDNVGEMQHDTPGSDRIVEVLLDTRPGPVYLQAWGGTNTIARALWKIQHEHPDRMPEVSRKAILFLILDQDATFREYVEPNWPDLLTLGSFRQFATVAYRWDQEIPEELHAYFDRPWMERNILQDHGPWCARYEAHPQKGFRSEGDSPAFMHQIPVGLRSLEHPGFGGWGGRFIREEPRSNVWKGARDGGDLGKPIWRFAEAFQNDWAARADWCVRSVDKANHSPQAQVQGPLDRTARPGETVTLSAAPSNDPDDNPLSYRWWEYTDVDTCEVAVELTPSDDGKEVSFVVPNEPGNDVHVILEVTDQGDPPLTRYQRIIITIAPPDVQEDSAEREADSQKQFERLVATNWREVLRDSGTQDWHEHWSLDGQQATVKNTPDGMELIAGPEFNNDAHHMVLWTRQSFAGDVRIDYEYTRLDSETRCVTILYVQATGSGTPPYTKDILHWSSLRTVPAMRMYFNHMHTYHISYAAFPNDDADEDYIRSRRYMPEANGLQGTDLTPDYLGTGLFQTGVPHQITVIKQGQQLFMHIRTADKQMLCHWKNETLPPILEGRIGLRHMYTRSARYRNVTVSAPQ